MKNITVPLIFLFALSDIEDFLLFFITFTSPPVMVLRFGALSRHPTPDGNHRIGSIQFGNGPSFNLELLTGTSRRLLHFDRILAVHVEPLREIGRAILRPMSLPTE